MDKTSILFGVLLIGLALYGYLGAAPSHRSATALIPAGVGVPLLVCGLLAVKERFRRSAMHAAATFALLGTLAAGGRGLPKIGVLFSDDVTGNPRAVIMVLIMFTLCLAFLGLCVKSFLDARRRLVT